MAKTIGYFWNRGFVLEITWGSAEIRLSERLHKCSQCGKL